MSLGEIVHRGAYLGALTVAPAWLSPEPRDATAFDLLWAVAGLGAPIALTAWLRRAAQTAEATAAVALWSATAVALVLIASRTDAPLLRSYYLAAPFVWISLATTAAAAAGHFLGTNWKNKRVGAAVAVLAAGIFLFRSAHELVASPKAMWEEILRRDAGDARAFVALYGGARPTDRAEIAALEKATDACIARKPDACACLLARAERGIARSPQRSASDVATAAKAGCSPDTTFGGSRLGDVRALAAAKVGDVEGARAALAGREGDATSQRIVLARALLAQAEGSPAVAEPLARKAIELGGADQRDAKLLLASLLIGRSAPADARPILAELVAADPHDADALYDQALTDDLGGNYNGAREGYLRALRENPELRAARYNLAVLTLRQGIVQEARHHAQKFAESWPDDPRGGELLRLTGAAAK